MAASLSNPHRKTGAAPCPNIRKLPLPPADPSPRSQQKGHSPPPQKKSGTRDPQNSPLPERLACPHVTISESLKGFLYFNFETNFLENEN